MSRNGAMRPLLKSDIEVAQANTHSGAEAARYLNITYNTYKKWAKSYGLFDSFKNATGWGSDASVKRPPPVCKKIKHDMMDIFAGKYPGYGRDNLRRRLIADGFMKEECAMCGYKERRIIDGKVPLRLDFIDDNEKNMKFNNLRLLCHNCKFLVSDPRNIEYLT